MRCVLAAFAALAALVVLQTCPGLAAADANKDDAVVKEACHKLVADPFQGRGPEEWSRPFQGIDPFRAIPVCKEALRRHPDDSALKLDLALAYLAGRKNEEATPLLDRLVSEGNGSAMLALAYISSKVGGAALMRRAAEAGNASGLMLYGMALMSGNGVPKDVTAGIQTMRKAAEAGSTRAMLILAHFYYKGENGVGYNRKEAERLVAEAAGRGDPNAKEALANLKLNAEVEAHER
jgi:TPR repeat protein